MSSGDGCGGSNGCDGCDDCDDCCGAVWKTKIINTEFTSTNLVFYIILTKK